MADSKSIFITGAASGIGRETALPFARRGWQVGLFDIDQAGLNSLQKAIGAGDSILQITDVTDPESVQRALETFADATGGRMDVLFNNAGTLHMGPHETIPLAGQQHIVDVNFKGVLNCIHFALPLLKNTPGARIINMSSASAFYGIPELAVYSATKHALSGLTEALDLELEPYGITVCDLQAPYVQTPMILAAEKQAFSVGKMGIKLTPDQIAKAVWKAAQQQKLHWKLGGPAIHFLFFLFWAFPFAKRRLVKSLALGPQGKRS
ncbi:MAG: SDR family oxidoreductase [Deltaproteobacteria bacterium]|nr:SDR family oxidoreductase [Deltaproteobacteria bacterium]